MAIRSTSGDGAKLYSSQSELEWAEKQLVSCLYMLGYSIGDLEIVTIDDLVTRCSYMYEPHTSYPLLPETLPNSNTATDLSGRIYEAGYSFGNKQKSLMMMIVRRMWRRYHMAKHEVESNV